MLTFRAGALIMMDRLLLWSICYVLFVDVTQSTVFTDKWAVHFTGGEGVAKVLARKHGFVYLEKILPDYYHLQHRKVAKRSISPSHYHHRNIKKEKHVHWVQQLIVKRRVKRDLNAIPSHANLVAIPPANDPHWSRQWYLNRAGGLNMNVQKAWELGYTGKNVVVSILDDGLESNHPDLVRNYDARASYDVNDRDSDPTPRYDYKDENRHGTRCAGEIAAVANNSVCIVGVAYDAFIGGVRMLDGDVTDAVEAISLSLNPQHIDIYSASWGPDDDGRTVDGPSRMARKAFIDGIKQGRGGLGSVFVWASGNGGRQEDNCNCDGYTNSIYTLSISSATEKGNVPWYSEACSSTLATTYSSGNKDERQIATTDLRQRCTYNHTGTSASAPLAAGIVALALEANPRLTWRDLQHIVVRTANPANLYATDWKVNGVGRKVSHAFGYGLMDAEKVVKVAANWTSVPNQHRCEVPALSIKKTIPGHGAAKFTIDTNGCDGMHNHVKYLEHVMAKVTLTAGRRGDTEIFLISPMGTRSTLLARRPRDVSRGGFNEWEFMTVHNWGEEAYGTWTLEINNLGAHASDLHSWTLIMYGTSPKGYQKSKAGYQEGTCLMYNNASSRRLPLLLVALSLIVILLCKVGR